MLTMASALTVAIQLAIPVSVQSISLVATVRTVSALYSSYRYIHAHMRHYSLAVPSQSVLNVDCLVIDNVTAARGELTLPSKLGTY